MSMADKLATIAANEQRVYDAGQKVFWDYYQSNGSRQNYENAFSGRGWTVNTFKPKYNLTVTRAYMLFFNSAIDGDLPSLLQGLGVTLNFNSVPSFQYAFQSCKFTHIGVIHAENATTFFCAFADSTQIETIDKIILGTSGKAAFGNGFRGCAALRNITFEGVIGQDISFADSPLLTHDSIINIISCLQDLTGTGNTRTLTLGATNLAKLTDAEKAVATEKGWTLA